MPGDRLGVVEQGGEGGRPAPSATVFSRSTRTRMAFAISASVTATMRSTCWRTRGKVISPTRLTAMPSAMVSPTEARRGPPESRAVCMLGQAAASTPTMRTAGRRARIAVAIPDTRPPPPTGTTTVSRSGACSRSSSPIVPWPATTISSSNAWT